MPNIHFPPSEINQNNPLSAISSVNKLNNPLEKPVQENGFNNLLGINNGLNNPNPINTHGIDLNNPLSALSSVNDLQKSNSITTPVQENGLNNLLGTNNGLNNPNPINPHGIDLKNLLSVLPSINDLKKPNSITTPVQENGLNNLLGITNSLNNLNPIKPHGIDLNNLFSVLSSVNDLKKPSSITTPFQENGLNNLLGINNGLKNFNPCNTPAIDPHNPASVNTPGIGYNKIPTPHQMEEALLLNNKIITGKLNQTTTTQPTLLPNRFKRQAPQHLIVDQKQAVKQLQNVNESSLMSSESYEEYDEDYSNEWDSEDDYKDYNTSKASPLTFVRLSVPSQI